ncbi:WXG100 family type VII secretion target [Streptomyces sp. BG9H]|uniref:WXG100 family type VII secretion target n=1 Tax=Streptomyces anatolicus TaxID=2675858 RepID=A0ABS6YLY3_9ACTN|nr:WXG100 family type VII secretion target [Streptomyces anatolicus]MBW5422377.1 WXG100 family type VII secretion target [Streptomyces anatolicus]
MSADYSNDDLTKLADKVRNFHTDVSKRVTSLNSVVDMIQAGWKGAAGKEFDTLQRGVNLHLKKLQDNLQDNLVDLEDVMRMSVKGFDGHEQERIAQIRKVDNSYEVPSKIIDDA